MTVITKNGCTNDMWLIVGKCFRISRISVPSCGQRGILLFSKLNDRVILAREGLEEVCMVVGVIESIVEVGRLDGFRAKSGE